MEDRYVFALGYPIGFSFKDNVESYNVQLNENIYPLSFLGAFVWMAALNGKQTKEEIFNNVIEQLQLKGYLLGKDYTVENLEFMYSELIAAFLLIEVSVDENPFEFFEKNHSLRISRKGFGIGIDFDNIIVHEDGRDIKLDSFEYYLWQLASESRTLEETYKDYSKSVALSMQKMGADVDALMYRVDRSFMEGFINLYNKNLIYIVGI